MTIVTSLLRSISMGPACARLNRTSVARSAYRGSPLSASSCRRRRLDIDRGTSPRRTRSRKPCGAWFLLICGLLLSAASMAYIWGNAQHADDPPRDKCENSDETNLRIDAATHNMPQGTPHVRCGPVDHHLHALIHRACNKLTLRKYCKACMFVRPVFATQSSPLDFRRSTLRRSGKAGR